MGIRDVDNLVRHACSKLASLHFVMTDEHRDRLLALGEPVDRIHVVGNPALDAFRTAPHQSRSQTLNDVDAAWIGERPYAVVVHHPTFSDLAQGALEMGMILGELARQEIPTIIGLPNADAGSRAIMDTINKHVATGKAVSFQGLPRTAFVNLLRHAALLIGNSSMGLLEAPSIPLPVVNVGSRQLGRRAAQNVVFAEATEHSIRHAIEMATSPFFWKSLENLVNPYGDGFAAERVIAILAKGIDPLFADKTFDPLQTFRR